MPKKKGTYNKKIKWIISSIPKFRRRKVFFLQRNKIKISFYVSQSFKIKKNTNFRR